MIDGIGYLKHHWTDGVYIKETGIKGGYRLAKHKHSFSHLSTLCSGKVEVIADGVPTVYTAPCVIEIKAGIMHEINAIEYSVWLCIHATDEKDESKVDQVLIEKGA